MWGEYPYTEIYRRIIFYDNMYEIIFQFFYNLELCVNCMLFIDILLIIRNPFYPQKARAKYYYIDMFGFMLI